MYENSDAVKIVAVIIYTLCWLIPFILGTCDFNKKNKFRKNGEE